MEHREVISVTAETNSEIWRRGRIRGERESEEL
jgi:hypothetical protein